MMENKSDLIDSLNSVVKRTGGASHKEQRVHSEYYQCAVFYSEVVQEKKMFKKGIKVVFPFYSSEIFVSDEEAQNFMPYFISELIKKKFIPNDVIDENHVTDEDKIRCAIAPLKVTVLEKEKSEVMMK